LYYISQHGTTASDYWHNIGLLRFFHYAPQSAYYFDILANQLSILPHPFSFLFGFIPLLILHLASMILSMGIGLVWQTKRSLIYRLALGVIGLIIWSTLTLARYELFGFIVRCGDEFGGNIRIQPSFAELTFIRIYESLLAIGASFVEAGSFSASGWLKPEYMDLAHSGDIFPNEFQWLLFYFRQSLVLLTSAGIQAGMALWLLLRVGHARKKS
jgi:hypothetical protein